MPLPFIFILALFANIRIKLIWEVLDSELDILASGGSSELLQC